MDLSNNSLTALPTEVDVLRSLTLLDVSHNFLQALPSTISTLKETLRLLNISHNSIHSLPDCMAELFHLEELWASGNKLEAAPVISVILRQNPLLRILKLEECHLSRETLRDIVLDALWCHTSNNTSLEELELDPTELKGFDFPGLPETLERQADIMADHVTAMNLEKLYWKAIQANEQEILQKVHHSPLMAAKIAIVAAFHDHAEVIRLLKAEDPSSLSEDHRGLTPLLVASAEGSTKVVEVLLSEPFLSTSHRSSPLHSAITHKRLAVAKLLVAHYETDIDQFDISSQPLHTPFSLAYSTGFEEIISDMMEVLDVEINFLTCIEFGYIGPVKYLLALGVVPLPCVHDRILDIENDDIADLSGQMLPFLTAYENHPQEITRALRVELGFFGNALFHKHPFFSPFLR